MSHPDPFKIPAADRVRDKRLGVVAHARGNDDATAVAVGKARDHAVFLLDSNTGGHLIRHFSAIGSSVSPALPTNRAAILTGGLADSKPSLQLW